VGEQHELVSVRISGWTGPLCPECGQDDLVRNQVISTGEIVDVCPECDALHDVASGTWHELEDFLAARGLGFDWTNLKEIGDT